MYAAPPELLFGATPAVVSYYGLAPSFTGLYQFNVVVPHVAADNAEPISITSVAQRAVRHFSSQCRFHRSAELNDSESVTYCSRNSNGAGLSAAGLRPSMARTT